MQFEFPVIPKKSSPDLNYKILVDDPLKKAILDLSRIPDHNLQVKGMSLLSERIHDHLENLVKEDPKKRLEWLKKEYMQNLEKVGFLSDQGNSSYRFLHVLLLNNNIDVPTNINEVTDINEVVSTKQRNKTIKKTKKKRSRSSSVEETKTKTKKRSRSSSFEEEVEEKEEEHISPSSSSSSSSSSSNSDLLISSSNSDLLQVVSQLKKDVDYWKNKCLSWEPTINELKQRLDSEKKKKNTKGRSTVVPLSGPEVVGEKENARIKKKCYRVYQPVLEEHKGASTKTLKKYFMEAYKMRNPHEWGILENKIVNDYVSNYAERPKSRGKQKKKIVVNLE